jgi:hypothetical protein
LTVTNEPPVDHYTNLWWHLHRKLVIDVDNNIWGSGMPNPVFMVYFDQLNQLHSWDGTANTWVTSWTNGLTYEKDRFYKIELERTTTHYILSVSTEAGMLIESAMISIDEVWHGNPDHDDEYLVIGEPHENYYQGHSKIKSIEFTPRESQVVRVNSSQIGVD